MEVISRITERAQTKNPYRARYEGFFLKRLRSADIPALQNLLEEEDGAHSNAQRKAGALLEESLVCVGIYDCRGRSCRLSLYDAGAPLSAAMLKERDGRETFLIRTDLKASEGDLHFEEVLRFVTERNLYQSGRGAQLSLPPEEEAFATDAAKRARAIRGLTAIIATHDFVERVGTHYED
ncbi:MAG: hypothetical protein PUE63_12480 [Lachnospiraceae bacterium]|nr:hypothetical protein [Lachnospiraceae bacterium]